MPDPDRATLGGSLRRLPASSEAVPASSEAVPASSEAVSASSSRRASRMRSFFPDKSSSRSAPGLGLAARIRRRMRSAGSRQSRHANSRPIREASVASASTCGRKTARPSAISSTAASNASAASSARRSLSSPAVSAGPISVSRTRQTSPASISLTTRMTETPVLVSPSRMDHWIGAAPRQRGSRLACALIIREQAAPAPAWE